MRLNEAEKDILSIFGHAAFWAAVAILLALGFWIVGCDGHHAGHSVLPSVTPERAAGAVLCRDFAGHGPARWIVPGKGPNEADGLCFVAGECFYRCKGAE